MVVLAAHLNLITSGKIADNPITDAIHDAFGLK
jgi:hypothetical protein